MEQRRQQTLYQVLQVSPLASSEVIRAAYRTLARTYHPDLNAGPVAERQMGEINAAYAVLSDPARRAFYDARLARAARVVGGGRQTATRTRRADSARRVAPGARRVNGRVGSPIVATADPTTRASAPVGRALAMVATVVLLAAMLTLALWFVADALDDRPKTGRIQLTEAQTWPFGPRPAEGALFAPAGPSEGASLTPFRRAPSP